MGRQTGNDKQENGREDRYMARQTGRQTRTQKTNRRKEREINTKTDIKVVKSIENDQITPALWVWVV